MKKFILGLLIGVAGIPIIEVIVDLVCNALEIPKASITKKILKENKIITELQVEQEPVNTYAIGFQHPDSYEESYDDHLEDKKSIKFGFHSK